MKLEVKRPEQCGPTCTIGRLFIDGENTCFTLEDVVRPDGVKVYGETAIPEGTYKVIVNFSNRFQTLMPLLLDVPGFEGIRIHKGNTDKDTHGCILLGSNSTGTSITDSKKAYDPVFARIKAAFDAGEEIWITIS
jgi:hypothetical protein